MRWRLAIISVVVGVALATPVAAPASSGKLTKRTMHPLCQLKQKPTRAELARGPRWLCKSSLAYHGRQGYRVHNITYGDCGEAWMWLGAGGGGWDWEAYGIWQWNGIWYGSAVLTYYNWSTGGHWAHNDYVWPSYSWQEWGSGDWQYLQKGTVGAWLWAWDVSDNGWICTDSGNQPFDIAWNR